MSEWRGIIFPRPRPAVARSAAYRAIPVRADGTADLSTTVPVALNPGLQYNVALFASHTDLDGVVACGNLTTR